VAWQRVEDWGHTPLGEGLRVYAPTLQIATTHFAEIKIDWFICQGT